jgi:hypothetical protein
VTFSLSIREIDVQDLSGVSSPQGLGLLRSQLPSNSLIGLAMLGNEDLTLSGSDPRLSGQ